MDLKKKNRDGKRVISRICDNKEDVMKNEIGVITIASYGLDDSIVSLDPHLVQVRGVVVFSTRSREPSAARGSTVGGVRS